MAPVPKQAEFHPLPAGGSLMAAAALTVDRPECSTLAPFQGKLESHLWRLQRVAICKFDLQPAAGRLEGSRSKGRQENRGTAEWQQLDACCQGASQVAVRCQYTPPECTKP